MYIVKYTYIDYHDYGEDTCVEYDEFESKQDVIDRRTEIEKRGWSNEILGIYKVEDNLVDVIIADKEEVKRWKEEQIREREERKREDAEKKARDLEIWERKKYEELKKKYEGSD